MEKGMMLALHKVLIFAGIMLLAYLYKILSTTISETDGERLTKIVYNITLPLLLLHVAYTAHIPADVWVVPILAAIAILITWAMVKGIFGTFTSEEDGKLLQITATMGNTAYMGYPIVESLLGASALTYAVAYNITQTTLFLTLIYPTLGGKGNKKKILSPPLVGFLIGILLRYLIPYTPPSWSGAWDIVLTIAESVGKTSSPLIMISLGLITSFSGIFKYIWFIFLTFVGKFVATPLVHLGVVLSALYLIPLIPGIPNLSHLAAMAIMLQASMPVMMASVIYAGGAHLNTKKAAAAVTLTTVASLILLPVFYALIRFIF